MTSFDPIHFVPIGRKTQILASPVTSITVVAHENLGHTNHWCFYLATSPTTSIQLDCQPSHSVPSTVLKGGSKANLIISEVSYSVPPEAEAQFVLDVAPGLSVSDIYNRIMDSGVHRYEFDENGVGCRNWVTDQLHLLCQARFIVNPEQIAQAKAGILKLWPDRTPNPLDHGAYY